MQPRILQLMLMVLAGCARSGAAEGPDLSGVGPSDTVAGAPQDENAIDKRISLQVRQAILDDKGVGPDASGIRVSTRDSVVTLLGYVRTDLARQRAGLVARAVGSVARVENRLVVDAEAARAQEPAESAVERVISDRVRQAFAEDRALAAEARGVSVRTQEGVVRLSGTVTSEATRARMALVANAVGSVKRVENRLALKAP